MTENDLIALLARRLLAKIERRFPDGRGLDLSAMRLILHELLAELTRERLIEPTDEKSLDALAAAVSRFGLADVVTGQGDEENGDAPPATRH